MIVETTTRHQVICGDNLIQMREMPAASVDLVFCSPPYEAARTYGIDFNLRGQDWVDWCVDRYMECLRVSRGLVAWVVEGQTRNFRYSAVPALLMADLHRRGVNLRKPPIMHRVGIPGSGGPDWLRNDYEWIICATGEGKLPWSDNTARGHPPKWAPGGEMSNRVSDGTRRNQWGAVGSAKGMGAKDKHGNARPTDRPSHRIHTMRDANGEMRQQGYDAPVKANPGNVIRVIVGGGCMGSKLAHENEAPFTEDIADFFIRSFCPPQGTVLDCCGGSGTTAAAAIKSGRNSISIDIRENQCELINRRIAEAHALALTKEPTP